MDMQFEGGNVRTEEARHVIHYISSVRPVQFLNRKERMLSTSFTRGGNDRHSFNLVSKGSNTEEIFFTINGDDR